MEVVEAVSDVWGQDRVGVRLSPLGTFNDMGDDDPGPMRRVNARGPMIPTRRRHEIISRRSAARREWFWLESL
jgi:2,4-dienoyl-CoA reductase-like NADH-dependent reductase (Old Yellow Enzyme family)